MAKIAYFDCFSGVSGDMFIGALLDAGLDFDVLRAELDKLGLPDCKLETRRVSRQHLSCTKFDVVDEGVGAAHGFRFWPRVAGSCG